MKYTGTLLCFLATLWGCAILQKPAVATSAQAAMALLAIEKPVVYADVCSALKTEQAPTEVVNAVLAKVSLNDTEKLVAKIALTAVEADLKVLASNQPAYLEFVGKICP